MAGGRRILAVSLSCRESNGKAEEMADISASMVMDLRQRTGLGMMECKKALTESAGDMAKAEELLRIRSEAKGRIASYVHGTRIGVIVDLTGGAETLGKDLAMHVAASKPLAVRKEDVPADIVAKERTIAAARAAESGKPANIVEKMIEGAVAKYVAEVTLLAQPFVKGDGKQTVGDLVKAQGADINGFVLFVVGEGIEKRKDDFAGEVAAMTRPKNGNGSGAAAT